MQGKLLPLFPLDKRWQSRRERWVSPPDTMRPHEFGVDVVPERDARQLVAEHHYSGSFPAARLSVGLYRKTGVAPAHLVGVTVFSLSINGKTIPRYSDFPEQQGLELGRFVCTPEVAFNGESWFLRRAFAALRTEKPQVRAVVSYADPMERTTDEGRLTKPAHAGQIYQASNAVFAGRSSPRWIWLTRTGDVVSSRALSKLRSGDRGHAYAERQLGAAGADPREHHESRVEWIDRVLRPPTFRRLRHPGNFAYVFGLDDEAKAQIEAATDGGLPYPKIRRAP
jgi:hypothetical protein